MVSDTKARKGGISPLIQTLKEIPIRTKRNLLRSESNPLFDVQN
jgi:hypothetical protein